MDVPFIKLFHTPNSGYFLDVNQNELVQVNDSSYEYLAAILSGQQEIPITMPQELMDLKEQGYLSTESNVKEVRHVYSNYLDLFLERKVGKITLQLTQNCNFRCKYCIYTEKPNTRQRMHSPKHMSWETAKDAVDFLWSHSVDSPRVNIGFYGGEPLLEFQLLKRVVDYGEKRFVGKDLSLSITTNGTLLTSEMVQFFQDHEVNLMISLDGPKEINDKNRVFANGKGTFDTVVNQIEMIKQIAPDYANKLQISMVMDPENDFDCINNIFLEGANFNESSVQATLVDHEFDDEKSNVSEEYSWKYEYQHFLAVLSFFKRFPENEVSPIARQAMASAMNDLDKVGQGSGLKSVDAPSGPCIPGQMRLFVDVSGKFFPCERVSENSSAMCIGSIKNGFDLVKADRILNVGQLTEPECRNCWCFRYCIQCVKKADDGSGKLSAQTRLLHCGQSKAAVYYNVLHFLMLRELPVYYPDQIRSEEKESERL